MTREILDHAASVRQKILNRSRAGGPGFLESIKDYGMERFLYRMGISRYRDSFVLKGALMFKVWDIKERRRTLDIDLLSYLKNDPDLIVKVIREICEIQVKEDGIIFDPGSVNIENIGKGQDYAGLRLKFTGKLEQAVIPMQIDFGFGDNVFPDPKFYKYPTILDMPSPEIKGYPVESMISEKFHAMVTHGALNSRMKDFYDIWIIKDTDIQTDIVSEAIKKTFSGRGTTIPGTDKILPEIAFKPDSDMQVKWEAFLRRREIQNVPKQFKDVAREVEIFFKKPLKEIEKGKKLEKDQDSGMTR